MRVVTEVSKKKIIKSIMVFNVRIFQHFFSFFFVDKPNNLSLSRCPGFCVCFFFFTLVYCISEAFSQRSVKVLADDACCSRQFARVKWRRTVLLLEELAGTLAARSHQVRIHCIASDCIFPPIVCITLLLKITV